jgi:hypothetical protein
MQSVTAGNSRLPKYISIYFIGTLLPYLWVVGSAWWGFALRVRDTCGERRRGKFVNLFNKLHVLIYMQSNVHRPCLVLFGNNTSLGHHMTLLVMEHMTWVT